jgi:hypothetical protein
MKRLLTAIVILAALGGIAWGVGAMVTQTAATRWLEDRANEGWVANAEEITVGGFPTQFVTEFQTLNLADPVEGIAWSTDGFRLEQDVHRLDRLRAIWPDAFTIASPTERITVEGLGIDGLAMGAMLDVQPTARLALDALDADTGPVLITSNAGWQTQWEQGSLRLSRLEDTISTYDLIFLTTMMAPPEAWRTRLDPAGLLPSEMDQAEARAQIAFDAPWDMDAIEQARPQITRLEVEEVSASWGDMLFRASGTLDVDADGLPEGEVAVRAENWRSMVDLAENAGLLATRLRPTTEGMLAVLAGMNGSEDNIDATLTFSGGRVFLGPLPIGPAPNLRLR